MAKRRTSIKSVKKANTVILFIVDIISLIVHHCKPLLLADLQNRPYIPGSFNILNQRFSFFLCSRVRSIWTAGAGPGAGPGAQAQAPMHARTPTWGEPPPPVCNYSPFSDTDAIFFKRGPFSFLYSANFFLSLYLRTILNGVSW